VEVWTWILPVDVLTDTTGGIADCGWLLDARADHAPAFAIRLVVAIVDGMRDGYCSEKCSELMFTVTTTDPSGV
jgi:hypothetical protein